MRISDWSSDVCSSDLSEDLVYTGYLYRIDELAADLPWKTLANRPNLLLALAWRRIRTLEFASAEKLIGAAEMAIETRISDQIYDSYDGDRMRNMLRHRRIMLEAGRDTKIGRAHV